MIKIKGSADEISGFDLIDKNYQLQKKGEKLFSTTLR